MMTALLFHTHTHLICVTLCISVLSRHSLNIYLFFCRHSDSIYLVLLKCAFQRIMVCYPRSVDGVNLLFFVSICCLVVYLHNISSSFRFPDTSKNFKFCSYCFFIKLSCIIAKFLLVRETLIMP